MNDEAEKFGKKILLEGYGIGALQTYEKLCITKRMMKGYEKWADRKYKKLGIDGLME